MRESIRDGFLHGVVGPSSPVAHWSKGSPSASDVWDTYVDIALLSRAKCLVTSRSGFSNIATWWGGLACVRTLDSCVAEVEQRFGAAARFEEAGVHACLARERQRSIAAPRARPKDA